MSDGDDRAAPPSVNEEEARLAALAARIERLAVKPAELSAARPWLRIAKPFLRLFRVRPQVRTKALRSLLASLHEADAAEPEVARASRAEKARAIEARKAGLQKAIRAALDELEESVGTSERAAVVDGPGAHGPLAGWLTRLHEVTRRALAATSTTGDETARRAALELDAEWALTPLTLQPKPASEADAEAAREVGAAKKESSEAVWEEDPRLVEVELAAIDRVLDAARAETHFLGRRRRLFESARKLLLDASAALPLDPAAVHGRAQHIADQIVLANRWHAAGVSPDVALPYQAVTAVTRGERERLYATLSAAYSVACCNGDVALASRARQALSRMETGEGARALGAAPGGVPAPAARDASTVLSASELLGDSTVGAIRDAYASARREMDFAKLAPAPVGEDAAELAERQELWDRYLHGDAVLATLSAAVSVDGCFEVGGTLAPVRVEEETRRVRVVSYPTQDLLFVPTGDASDLASSVIEDPRGVILALAEGRLLARKFRKVETVRTSHTRLTSEARIYVLDGSDSMLVGTSGRTAGARARMRDAILLAELATLYRRATEGGRGTRVVLFYRYFTKQLGDVARIATAAEAVDAMAQVVATPRHGGTDIEAALLASFAQIRQARADDRDLARAQIVLVTDGEAAVDEAAILAAREREGDFPIGVSVIALGEENPVLRRLVARQRARGEPAFYHFVSDDDLAAIVAGRRAAGAAVHAIDPGALAERDAGQGVPRRQVLADLAGDLGALVDEIETLDRSRAMGRDGASSPADAMGTASAAALAAAGLPYVETEAERARREAWTKDERALGARFDAWFPEPRGAQGAAMANVDSPEGQDPPAPHSPGLEAPDPADEEAVLVVLATLGDVLGDLGGTPVERRADAIELLERLLPDARLSPARYRAVAFAPAPRVARALASVRAAASAGPAREARKRPPAVR